MTKFNGNPQDTPISIGFRSFRFYLSEPYAFERCASTYAVRPEWAPFLTMRLESPSGSMYVHDIPVAFVKQMITTLMHTLEEPLASAIYQAGRPTPEPKSIDPDDWIDRALAAHEFLRTFSVRVVHDALTSGQRRARLISGDSQDDNKAFATILDFGMVSTWMLLMKDGQTIDGTAVGFDLAVIEAIEALKNEFDEHIEDSKQRLRAKEDET